MISQVITYKEQQHSVPFFKIDVEALIEQRLPPAPGSLIRLVNLLRDYNTPRPVLIEAVNNDPILVARILRLANSPIYAFEREIILIDMALTAIGSQAIYDIVIVELAARTFNSPVTKTQAYRKIWEHSVAVAVLTKEISHTLEMRGLEEAFICGILHDFGKFIFLNHSPQIYERILGIETEIEMVAAEEEVFGCNHAEIGSLIARRWNLPEEICHSILHHHSARHDQPKLVERIIEVADIFANVKGYGTRTESEEMIQYNESVIKLGLSPKFLDNIWNLSQSKITEMLNTFN